MKFICCAYEIKTKSGEPIKVNLELIALKIPKDEEQAMQFYNELISLLYGEGKLEIARIEDKSSK